MVDPFLTYESRLSAAGAPVVRRLAPGLPKEVVEERLRRIGLVPNDEILALYGWHDGATQKATDPVGPDSAIGPGVYFPSLDIAIELTEAARSIAARAADEAKLSGIERTAGDLWDDGWLAVFRESGSDLWGVGTDRDGAAGVWIAHWQAPTERIAESLPALISDWLGQLISGAWSIGERGEWVYLGV